MDFLTSGYQTQDHLLIRRLVLINTFFLLGIVVFSLFALVHLTGTHDLKSALFDVMTALGLLSGFLDLRRNRNIERAKWIGTLVLSVFMIVFAANNQNESFGLIWSIIVPIFVISLFGHRQGLLISLVFYFFFFLLAYGGIGIWERGNWDLLSVGRLVVASSLLMFMLYMTEYSFEKMQQSMNRLSTTDYLTQLYNRRKIDELLERQIDQARRDEQQLSVIIFDIDNFKLINDRFGHLIGDRVLCQLSDLLRKEIRKADSIGRWGGEEFIIITQHASEAEAKLYAERLRIMIETHFFPDVGHVSCSFGVCGISEQNQTMDRLVSCADQALYRAKERGKNQVVSGSDLHGGERKR